MKIETFIQKNIYSGLLIGLPNKSINNAILDNAYEDTLKNLGINKKEVNSMHEYLKFPVIITPKREESKFNTGQRTVDVEYLPPYFTNIVYTDGNSAVLLIMFTHSVGDMNEINEILKINDIDLKCLSKEIVW